MKYITGIFFAALVLFAACNNKAQGQKNEKILSVQVLTYGGEMGHAAEVTVTKDSIHSYSSIRDKRMEEHHTATPDGLWNKILSQCDLDKFAKIPNGESWLPVDGTDTVITVKTNKREISVRNGKGAEFDKLYNLIPKN